MITTSPAAGAGSSGAGLYQQAWVETSAHGGSDATGAVGTPAKPYATMAAAYAAGARHFNLGSGTHAGLSLPGFNISYCGKGRWNTTITSMACTNGSGVSLVDVGSQSAYISTISADGTSAAGQAGGNGGTVALYNVCAGAISSRGGDGAPNDPAESAHPGGMGGTVGINGLCIVSTIDCRGGNGGSCTDGFSSGGSGGNGGTVSGDMLIQNNVINASGGACGAYASPDGIGGMLNLEYCSSAIVTLSGGGTTGTSGAATVSKGNLSTLNFGPTNGGSINGTCIFVQNLTATSPSISAVLSSIAGTTY